jgi:molybdopterin-guanine dinucleotide biosynthesis protein A
MYNIPCIIFAGGKSSRMGEDKSLLPFGDFDSLCEFQLHKLRKFFKKVYISTKNPEKFNFKADFIIDKFDIYAPSAGFLSVYEELNYDRFFVLGVDIPFVNDEVVSKLIAKDSFDIDATVAETSNGIESLCGIYHRSLKSKFEKMLQEDNHKLRFMLKQSNIKTVNFDDRYFLNLNKPQEYQKAIQLL